MLRTNWHLNLGRNIGINWKFEVESWQPEVERKYRPVIQQETQHTDNQGTKASSGRNVFPHNSSVPTCAIENPNDESDYLQDQSTWKGEKLGNKDFASMKQGESYTSILQQWMYIEDER